MLVWGARERELLGTGDASSMPNKQEVLQSGPGVKGNGKPGDMPSAFHDVVDIDLALKAWGGDGFMRKLLLYVFRDGYEDHVVQIEHVLRDGSTVTLAPGDDPPAAAVSSSPITERRKVYDFARFEDPVLDHHLARYWPAGMQTRSRRRFLWMVLHEFGSFVQQRIEGRAA